MCQLGVSVACVDINIRDCDATVRRASQSLGIAKMFICNVTDKEEVSIISLVNVAFRMCKRFNGESYETGSSYSEHYSIRGGRGDDAFPLLQYT